MLVNDARFKIMSMLMDKVLFNLPVHVNLVGAGRGLDKLNENYKTAASEKGSIELYCKSTDTALIVRNMTTR